MNSKSNDDGATLENGVNGRLPDGGGCGAAGPLALDLTEEAVVLCLCQGGGSVAELARAPLDTPDFPAQIEVLRAEAVRQDPKLRPVTLWLPEAQVLMRRMSLGSKVRGPALAEAALRLQSETEHCPEDLSIDVSLSLDDSPSVVLAALAQTVREAKEYATKWGFVPGPVSTRCHADIFGARPPVFDLPKPAAANTAKRNLRLATAAVLLAGAGFGGWAYYDSLREMSAAPVIPDVHGRTARSFENADVVPDVRLTGGEGARPDFAVLLTLRSAATPDATAWVRIESAYVPEAKTVVPEILAAAEPVARLAIGAEPALPLHAVPTGLEAAGAAPAETGIEHARAAIDQIRTESLELAELPDGAARTVLSQIADANFPPEAAPGDVAGAPDPVDEAGAEPAGAADATPVSGEGTGAAEASQLAEDLQPVEDAAGTDAEELAVTDPNLPIPKPKPSSDAAPSDQAEAADASETDGDAVTAQTEDAPAAGAPDAESPDAADMADTADAPDAASGDDEETLAVAVSPTPIQRPEHLSAPDIQPEASRKTKAKPIAAGPSPARVSSAASETGLRLDETSLIGVIDTSNGRSALVRLPDGDFRKLARGDDLDGWRVSSIGRDRIRLTRQGRNRTLNLVSR